MPAVLAVLQAQLHRERLRPAGPARRGVAEGREDDDPALALQLEALVSGRPDGDADHAGRPDVRRAVDAAADVVPGHTEPAGVRQGERDDRESALVAGDGGEAE